MTGKRGKRHRRNINYANLDKGLHVSADGDSEIERADSTSLNSSLGPDIPNDETHEVYQDIARLKAEKQQLLAIQQLETINEKKREREMLVKEVEALKKGVRVSEYIQAPARLQRNVGCKICSRTVT